MKRLLTIIWFAVGMGLCGCQDSGDELSDDDLEKAAGGIDLISASTLSVDGKLELLNTIAGKMDYTDLLAYKEQIFF